MSEALRAGFVGLGDQGGPMAMRIARAGIALTVWARRAEVVRPFVDAGAAAATDLEALGAKSEVVGVCVLADRDVIEVTDPLLSAMPPGGVLLVHSTVHPDTVRNVAKRAAARGIAVLDAPVSGGAAAAEAGRLTVLAGGDAAALDRVRPVISSYAGLVAHLGPLGSGALAKLLNNAMMASNLTSSHEAVRAGAELGLDTDELKRVFLASSGGSFALEVYAHRAGPHEFGRSVDLLTKDVDLLESAARPGGVDVSVLADHARRFFSLVNDVRPADG